MSQLTHFGRNGLILRGSPADPLTLEEIRTRIPSIFAHEKHVSRSPQFSFIPTFELLEKMLENGLVPTEIRQGGSRDEAKLGFTRHLIRFRPFDRRPVAGDTFAETVVGNAHDGTAAFWTTAGVFRWTCSNGAFVGNGPGMSMKVPHRGKVDDVIEASFKIVKQFDAIEDKIEEMASISLTRPEQLILAQAATKLRFEETQQVQPAQLLITHREADNKDDLWTTFNVIQENVTQGGVTTTTQSPTGHVRQRRSRAVNGVAENVRLNQLLWEMAEQMRVLKTQ